MVFEEELWHQSTKREPSPKQLHYSRTDALKVLYKQPSTSLHVNGSPEILPTLRLPTKTSAKDKLSEYG